MSKVYPHKWQGPNRPIVATYGVNGEKIPWLLSIRDGNLTARAPGRNGDLDPDRYRVAHAAMDIYGQAKLEKALGQMITRVAYDELVS